MSDVSQFDASVFLDATTTEASTRRPPLPAGQDYSGIITDITSRKWQGKKDPSQSGVALDVKIEVQVPADQIEAQGTSTVTMTDGIMLDTTPSGGIDLSPGKNGKLRRYRESLGLNVAGQPFSPRMMIGRSLKVKVKHELYEGELYDRVDSVAKA